MNPVPPVPRPPAEPLPVRHPGPVPVAAVARRIRESARRGFEAGAHELHFHALGTRCRVSFTASQPSAAGRFAEAVLDWMARFEATYSRYLPDSLLSQINQAAGQAWMAIDAETARLLELCHQLHFLTQGLLDPTTLPLIQLWDWRQARVPSEAEIAAARAITGWRKVRRAPGRVLLPEPGMALDLGGVGKEYAVDEVVRLAASHGIPGLLVDFGADVRVAGPPPDGRPAWVIGLENPDAPGTAWGTLVLREGAVATSGDYLRGFNSGGRRHGHILDPRTGWPVDNGCRAVSVWAPSCTQAGMLSTAAFVLGEVEGLRLLRSSPHVEGCLLTRHGRRSTPRFHEYLAT